MGSVKPINGGKVEVGEDFELLGWDFVSNHQHWQFMTAVNESVSRQTKQESVLCNEYCKAQDLMREIITELS